MAQWWSRTAVCLAGDLLRLVASGWRSHRQLVAENLFLRKQLALYRERRVKPRRPANASRIALVVLSQVIDWRTIITVVQPDTPVAGNSAARVLAGQALGYGIPSGVPIQTCRW